MLNVELEPVLRLPWNVWYQKRVELRRPKKFILTKSENNNFYFLFISIQTSFTIERRKTSVTVVYHFISVEKVVFDQWKLSTTLAAVWFFFLLSSNKHFFFQCFVFADHHRWRPKTDNICFAFAIIFRHYLHQKWNYTLISLFWRKFIFFSFHFHSLTQQNDSSQFNKLQKIFHSSLLDFKSPLDLNVCSPLHSDFISLQICFHIDIIGLFRYSNFPIVITFWYRDLTSTHWIVISISAYHRPSIDTS